MLYFIAGIILLVCCLGTVCRAYDRQPRAWIVRCTRGDGTTDYEVYRKVSILQPNILYAKGGDEAWAKWNLQNLLDQLNRGGYPEITKREIVHVE